jgi:hypothetical protein
MFILRPSSFLKPPEKATGAERVSEIEEIKAIPAIEEPYVDLGLPVPDTYEIDICRAMLQDPFRVFIYWEVREESLKSITRYFSPEEQAAFQVTLKLTDLKGGLAYFEVARRGRYWMMVFPDREYDFEIGMRSPEHGFIPVVRSNRVRTPSGTVSPETAEEPQYRLSPPEFIDVIEASGFAADRSLDLTVAAMPGTEAEADKLAQVIYNMPEALRAAVMIAGAGGELTEEMVAGLPEHIRNELMRLLREAGGKVAAIGLVHYLPEVLREALEDEREFIGDHVHPLHIGPRFFIGGSEIRSWPGGEIRVPALPARRAPGSWSPPSSWMLGK